MGYVGRGVNTDVLTEHAGGTLPNFQPGGSGFNSIVNQVFTMTGTYTPTVGMKFVSIQCIGGGAAGGGSNTTGGGVQSVGSGGGAGEFAEGIFNAASIGASQAVTIGAGGTGVAGGTGNSGGNTSVGALISSNGGTGGVASPSTTVEVVAGGAGGTGGSGGDFRTAGNRGMKGLESFSGGFTYGGDGGNSMYGSIGQGAGLTGGPQAPVDGSGFGVGGGGSITPSSTGTTGTGGAGMPGIVIVTEFISA